MIISQTKVEVLQNNCYVQAFAGELKHLCGKQATITPSSRSLQVQHICSIIASSILLLRVRLLPHSVHPRTVSFHFEIATSLIWIGQLGSHLWHQFYQKEPWTKMTKIVICKLYIKIQVQIQVCMRIELYGCSYRNKVASYTAPEGHKFSSG